MHQKLIVFGNFVGVLLHVVKIEQRLFGRHAEICKEQKSSVLSFFFLVHGVVHSFWISNAKLNVHYEQEKILTSGKNWSHLSIGYQAVFDHACHVLLDDGFEHGVVRRGGRPDGITHHGVGLEIVCVDNPLTIKLYKGVA